MLQTYELYLDVGEGEPRFRSLTCEGAELTRRVHEIIAEEEAASAEVRQFGEHLFTLFGSS